jgi:putative transposase
MSITICTGYNEEHRHSAIKFVKPMERRTGMHVEILAAREALSAQAKAERPERWSGQTRDWSRPEVAVVNPDKPAEKSGARQQEMA